jgi:hypothetical protein
MMIAALSVLGFSILGVLLLFAVKKYELSRGVLVGGSMRDDADLFALRVKWIFLVIEWYLARLPDFIFLLTRYGIRISALFTARIARRAEAQAHSIADFVSHKRNFERRETRSNYLKQVGEHKSDNGHGPVATQ